MADSKPFGFIAEVTGHKPGLSVDDALTKVLGPEPYEGYIQPPPSAAERAEETEHRLDELQAIHEGPRPSADAVLAKMFPDEENDWELPEEVQAEVELMEEKEFRAKRLAAEVAARDEDLAERRAYAERHPELASEAEDEEFASEGVAELTERQQRAKARVEQEDRVGKSPAVSEDTSGDGDYQGVQDPQLMRELRDYQAQVSVERLFQRAPDARKKEAQVYAAANKLNPASYTSFDELLTDAARIAGVRIYGSTAEAVAAELDLLRAKEFGKPSPPGRRSRPKPKSSDQVQDEILDRLFANDKLGAEEVQRNARKNNPTRYNLGF